MAFHIYASSQESPKHFEEVPEVRIRVDRDSYKALLRLFAEGDFDDLVEISHLHLRDHMHPMKYRDQNELVSKDLLVLPLQSPTEKEK